MAQINTIEVLEKNYCSGCAACSNRCPVDAITMKADHEGFLFPQIEHEICIDCGVCHEVCPALNEKEVDKKRDVKCLAVMASDEIRKTSSSGGMFTLAAKYILKKGGVVVGAAWDDEFELNHIIVRDEKELYKLRGSKYIQSKIGKIYRLIESELKNDQYVLFSGCPCQVDGLKSFLGKEYDKLYTIDIICHGVPSEKILKKYIEEKCDKEKIEEINFRDKSKYKWSTTVLIKTDKQLIQEDYKSSRFWYAYRNGLIYREACYNCKYANMKRTGDITIGDFWGIWEYKRNMNDGMGTSLVLVNSDKGNDLIEYLKTNMNEELLVIEEAPMELALRYNVNLQYPAPRNLKRDLFWNKLDEIPFSKALESINREKFDVGIVGYWYATNYGSVVTYYALYKAIERLGYTPVLIDRPEKERDPEGLNVFPRKFLESKIDISKSVKWTELDTINDMCDTFVVGSDQVWTPGAIRHMGYFFFLSFIYDEKRKIAYAPSFGQSTFKVLPDTLRKVKYFGNKFDRISVREDMGVEICKDVLQLNAQRVLDPVFLIEEEDYNQIADEAERKEKGDYIVSYILDPTEDKRTMLLETSKKLNLPLLNMLDGRFNTFEHNNEKLNLPNTIKDVNVPEWVSYIKNAKYVITDSHHGLAMAIIFNKQFVCYANASRGQSRFTSLLNLLGLSDRMVFSTEEMIQNGLLVKEIDYKWVNMILAREKQASLKWLEEALKCEKKQIPSDYDIAIRNAKDEIDKRCRVLNQKIFELEEKIRKMEERNE